MKITLDGVEYNYTPMMEPDGMIPGVILEIDDAPRNKRYIFGYKNGTLRYGKVRFKGATRFMTDVELAKHAKRTDAERVCSIIYQSLQ